MTFKNIYNDIAGKLADQAYFDASGATKPVTVAWYTGQYNEALKKENNEGYPFNTPAVFVEFGEIREFSQPAGLKSNQGELPISLHVVRDVIGLDGNENKGADWEEVIDYPEVIAALFTGEKSSACNSRYRLAGIRPDHDNDGLMVFVINYLLKVIV